MATKASASGKLALMAGAAKLQVLMNRLGFYEGAMKKSDFPLITRITEARTSDDEHLSIRMDVWTDDGQRYVRLSRIAARQLFEQLEGILHPGRADPETETHEPLDFLM
jgi:hypothetical protein